MKKGRFASSSPTPPSTPPSSAASPTTPPPSGGSGPQPSTGKGFGAALRALVERKFRELSKTQRWQGVSEAKRRAEARRRGTDEMSKRLQRETGKRPASSTVTRNASKGKTPKGADQQRLDRQAAIDRAGGLKQFASKAKISSHQARRWRDSGGPIHTSETIVVDFDVTGDLQHGQHSLDEPETLDVGKHLTGNVTLDGVDADDFIEAYAAGDIEAQKEILGVQIAQTILIGWDGNITRTYTVRTIISLNIRD
ncbi:hypothetical protein A5739_24385 [Mycobacterium colombiense]|uniref:hypothetical protein n=1 Tax=Mycobacteriaceae TaxID=1762 RepID=UPI00096CE853|nr:MULTISPECIES: hypothetical protein [Mycobacteriaceae]MCV7136469.1 hypothetical protein [Mycolicibacterium hodleri]OMC24194.1 hypothetical protein A5739_24385 [Mycobacterium colombiense]